MKEGWCAEDYWILCESIEESEQLTAKYGVTKYLPGFRVAGLEGWGDFILVNGRNEYYTVPTVPLDKEYLEPFTFPADTLRLETDTKYEKKIKWYILPVIFRGSLTDEKNVAWLPMDAHIRAVRWWNEYYYKIRERG